MKLRVIGALNQQKIVRGVIFMNPIGMVDMESFGDTRGQPLSRAARVAF